MSVVPGGLWFDAHCHLQDFDDPRAVIERARGAAVRGMICAGTGVESSAQAVGLASQNDDIWATIGLHPHEASAGVSGLIELADRLLDGERTAQPNRPCIVAIGECGLDYHYDHSPRDAQQEAFAAQIALAKRYGITLVVHTREAWDDTMRILLAEGPPERTVLHCFTGGPLIARRALDAGCYLSFSGIITFKNAGEIRDAAVLCPPGKLLVETDAPFLAPVPHRGRQNEPAFIHLVAATVAELRSVPLGEVALQLAENTVEAFSLPADTRARTR